MQHISSLESVRGGCTVELNNEMIRRSFLPSINVIIYELMLPLIVLKSAGAGSDEGAGFSTGASAAGEGAGGLGEKSVERGTGVSPGIYGGAHVCIRKEVSNSTKLGAGKICASLRVRAMMDFQYIKVRSCT